MSNTEIYNFWFICNKDENKFYGYTQTHEDCFLVPIYDAFYYISENIAKDLLIRFINTCPNYYGLDITEYKVVERCVSYAKIKSVKNEN